MSKEQLPNPTERKTRFVQWCKDEGIEKFLFDLDDTVCSTREVFMDFMSQAYDHLASNAPHIAREKWEEEIKIINNRLFEKMGVSPNRWNLAVDELAEKYSLGGEINQETKRIFQLIYTTPLVLKNNAEEGLAFVKESEIPMGFVTHAGEAWTWKKYDWLGLNRFVSKNDFFIVDENGHKTSESWTQAIDYFGLAPNQVAIAGDSPRSDINPAWEVGVKHCFLVEDKNQWSVHKQPVHQNVKKISHLNQIAEAILEQ